MALERTSKSALNLGLPIITVVVLSLFRQALKTFWYKKIVQLNVFILRADPDTIIMLLAKAKVLIWELLPRVIPFKSLGKIQRKGSQIKLKSI